MPYGDGEFDGAVVTVSVQYMTRPVEIFRDVARVLRPGAPFVVTYSNRMFPTKAVRIWRSLDDRDRATLIATYFKHAGGFGDVQARDCSGRGDPLYAVWAHTIGPLLSPCGHCVFNARGRSQTGDGVQRSSRKRARRSRCSSGRPARRACAWRTTACGTACCVRSTTARTALTIDELAAACALDVRYVRAWAKTALAGELLEYDAESERFTMAPFMDSLLLDDEDFHYLAGLVFNHAR